MKNNLEQQVKDLLKPFILDTDSILGSIFFEYNSAKDCLERSTGTEKANDFMKGYVAGIEDILSFMLERTVAKTLSRDPDTDEISIVESPESYAIATKKLDTEALIKQCQLKATEQQIDKIKEEALKEACANCSYKSNDDYDGSIIFRHWYKE